MGGLLVFVAVFTSLIGLYAAFKCHLTFARHSKLGNPGKTPTLESHHQRRPKFGLWMSETLEASTGTNTAISQLNGAIESGPIPLEDRKFVINGWRWHIQSVLTDIDRFVAVLAYIQRQQYQIQESSEFEKLSSKAIKAYDFVFGFNWKALMKVEREIFFPWLAELIPSNAQELVVDIVGEHEVIEALIEQLGNQCLRLASPSVATTSQRESILRECDRLVILLRKSAQKIQNVQENTLAPYISAHVTSKEQERFNNMVPQKLGILESQVHLVSMAEVAYKSPDEKRKWEENMPAIAKKMIPFWKKSFYNPKVECLRVPGDSG
jgi:hypothetical protein